MNSTDNRSATASSPLFMLIFRGTDWHKGLSPEEMQQVAADWMSWFDRLNKAGKAIAGNPLEKESRIVSGRNGIVVSDGPFAEAKETVGGYFLLRVATLDEAEAVARECPGLRHGAVVEIRPVAGECPVAAEAREESRLATV